MSEKGPNDTLPLPVVEGDPATDPAHAEMPGEPAAVEGAPSDTGAEAAVIAPPSPEDMPARPDGYVRQSREAYRDAKESGRRFMRRIGQTAVGKFVRFRKNGSTETSADAAEATTDDVERTRVSWVDRASTAKDRVMHRLETRWENRQQERENARYVRKGERIVRQNERDDRKEQKQQDRADQKRQEDVDRRADRLDDQIHKATMTRKEFNQYKYNKQARKDKERDDKMWADWRAQQEAKQRDKRVKHTLREHAAQQKAEAKTEKAGRKAANRAAGKAFKMNERYDDRHAKAAKLTAERDMIAALRDDPEAYAQYLKEQADQKHEQRQARVQRVQKIGGKIVHGANVATKVAVGAAVNGGEVTALTAMYAAEELGKDERVQYLKVRAELGWVAVRKSLGEVLAKASERMLPTVNELDAMADTGEVEVAPGVDVSIELHPDGHPDEGAKAPASV